MYLHLGIAFYRTPSWPCLLITISIIHIVTICFSIEDAPQSEANAEDSAPAEQTQNAEEGATAAPADQPDNAAAEPEATAAEPEATAAGPAKDEEAVDITNPAADRETADAAAPGNYHLKG